MVETGPDILSGYFVRSYEISTDLGRVAVNNSGDQIAIQSHGVSVWNISPYPKLTVMVPGETISVSWTESDKDLSTLEHNQDKLLRRTWSGSGYRSESYEESQRDRSLLEGYGFSQEHPKLEAIINGTTITIKRKSDSAIVDLIDLNNLVVLEVAFSQDGNEIISKSYDPSPAAQRYEQLNGYREFFYERWKIGYKNLGDSYKSRLSN